MVGGGGGCARAGDAVLGQERGIPDKIEAYDVHSLGRSHLFRNASDGSTVESLELDAGGLTYLWLRRHQVWSSAGPPRMSSRVSPSALIHPNQLPWSSRAGMPARAGGRAGGREGGGWGPLNYTLNYLARAERLRAVAEHSSLSRSESTTMGARLDDSSSGGGAGVESAVGDAFYGAFAEEGRDEVLLHIASGGLFPLPQVREWERGWGVRVCMWDLNACVPRHAYCTVRRASFSS